MARLEREARFNEAPANSPGNGRPHVGRHVAVPVRFNEAPANSPGNAATATAAACIKGLASMRPRRIRRGMLHPFFAAPIQAGMLQ